MKLHKNVELILADNRAVRCDVEEYTRGGTMSPSDFIALYEGKRYPHIARRVKNFRFGFSFLFQITYGDHLADLVYKENPFFKAISKSPAGELYHQPVVLGLEHGVTFAQTKTESYLTRITNWLTKRLV